MKVTVILIVVGAFSIVSQSLETILEGLKIIGTSETTETTT